jgi:thioesterase domain-containing protein
MNLSQESSAPADADAGRPPGESPSWAARADALPPAKRALLEELKRRRAAAAARTGSLAEAAWLRDGGGEAEDPVVLVHPIGGSLFCYQQLCQALPPGRPIAGIAAGPAFADPASAGSADFTVEALAADYVTRLTATGVSRPAVVAGWSFGGLVAYELAVQWHRTTDQLLPVVLIDSVTWPPDQAAWDQPATLRTFAGYLAGLADLPGDSVFDPALWPLPVSEALAEMASRFGELGAELGFSAAELDRRYWTYANAAAAMYRYRPAGYAGQVVLLRSAEAEAAGPWTGGGSVTVVAVGGDHYSVLRPPAVAEVARAITQAADRHRRFQG